MLNVPGPPCDRPYTYPIDHPPRLRHALASRFGIGLDGQTREAAFGKLLPTLRTIVTKVVGFGQGKTSSRCEHLILIEVYLVRKLTT